MFPWRPVVLVLGTDPDADGWADAVALVDALQDIDVDARLALPSPPSTTSRWVQPARASETTLRRVRPDAVLAWDPGAVDAAEAWSTGLRSLVVVERAGDGADVRTVPGGSASPGAAFVAPSGGGRRRPIWPPSSGGWPPVPSPRPPTRSS